MNENNKEQLVKLSELLEKVLEILDSVLREFISITETLPYKQQVEINKILKGFCDSMKSSLVEFEFALTPNKDYSKEYII